LNANSYPFGETDKIRAEILSIFKKLQATIKLIKADFPTFARRNGCVMEAFIYFILLLI